MKLTPHVYLISGPMYGSHQNVYAVETDQTVILIDTGLSKKDFSIIKQNLEFWKLSQKPISAVLLTHEHYEHISNAALFQQQGAKIYAHPSMIDAVKDGNDKIMYYAYADYEPLESFIVDETLADEKEFYIDNVKIKAYYAPGHSRASLLYEIEIDNETIVFSGDTILVTSICHKAAFGLSSGIDYNMEVLYETIKKFSSHYATILLPGHGEICMRKAEMMFAGAYLRFRLDYASNHYTDYLILQEGNYAD